MKSLRKGNRIFVGVVGDWNRRNQIVEEEMVERVPFLEMTGIVGTLGWDMEGGAVETSWDIQD